MSLRGRVHAFGAERAIVSISALGWILGRVLNWTPAMAAFGLVLAFLGPGLAFARVARLCTGDWTRNVLIGGALSAPLLGLVPLLLCWNRGSVDLFTLPILGLGLLGVLWPGPLAADPEEAAAARESAQGGRFALYLGLALAGIVALALTNPRPRLWSDAFYHAAVFREVERGGIPPGYPHFAGQPLSYNWFYQVALVAVRHVVHPDPFVLMALVNTWCALLLPLAAYHIARGMSVKASAAKWASLAVVLGTNPLGIVWLVVRSVFGETRGWNLFLHTISTEGTVQTGLVWNFSFFQGSFLGRLWTATAYDFALVLGAVAILFVQASLERLRWSAIFGYTTLLLLLLLWHPLTALQFMIGVAAGCAAAVLWSRSSGAAREALAPILIVVATALSYVAARPYLTLATQGLAPGAIARLGPSLPNLTGLMLSMGPLALAALASIGALDRRQALLHGAMMVAMVGVLLFVDVAGIGEEKFFYPLFLIVAATSAHALSRWWQAGGVGRPLLAAVMAASLAAVAVTAHGYILDRQPIRRIIDADQPERATFLTADEEGALLWIRGRSPREAVFVQPQRRLGTEPILVFGCRRLYLGLMREFYKAVLLGSSDRPPAERGIWAEMMDRERIQAECFSERKLASSDLARLRSAPWPLYVWWDSSLAGGRLSPTLADTARVTRVVFDSPSVRILELRR